MCGLAVYAASVLGEELLGIRNIWYTTVSPLVSAWPARDDACGRWILCSRYFYCVACLHPIGWREAVLAALPLTCCALWWGIVSMLQSPMSSTRTFTTDTRGAWANLLLGSSACFSGLYFLVYFDPKRWGPSLGISQQWHCVQGNVAVLAQALIGSVLMLVYG